MLASFDTEKISIICGDTLVAHCCGAIIKHFYILAGKDAEKLSVHCIANRSDIQPHMVENKDLVFFIETSMSSMPLHQDTTYVYISNSSRETLFPIEKNVIHLDGANGTVCTTLWQYFFSSYTEKSTPTCVSYIDNYTKGSASERAENFYYGMSLMETCPDTAQNFWESLFDCRENISSSASEEEIMERMKWDSMLQVVNMGSIVKVYLVLQTERACDYAMMYPNAVIVNIKDCIQDVLLSSFPEEDFVITCHVCGLTNDGVDIIFQYTIYTNKDNVNALALASKYGGSGTSRKATFLSTREPKDIGFNNE